MKKSLLMSLLSKSEGRERQEERERERMEREKRREEKSESEKGTFSLLVSFYFVGDVQYLVVSMKLVYVSL